MTSHFGWSLSDTTHDPSQTGLANFRHKFLLHQRTTSSFDDDELIPSTMRHRVSEAANSIDRPTKPYYRREPSTSQCSDSCFGSEYPSLTSTGSSEPESSMARTWIASSGASRSTGWTNQVTIDDTSRMSSGPPSSTSTDCWRGSIHHAMAVMEDREEEITSLFDQLHEIEDDLASMNNQVGKVSHSLQQCQQGKDRPCRPTPIYSSYSLAALNRQSSFSSFMARQHRRSCLTSCRDLNSLTEDEMADIVHRLLTRICELSLGRQEGRSYIPLIV